MMKTHHCYFLGSTMSPTPEQIAHARSTTANAVWNTADRYLRSVVEPEEYGDYIIPFAVLRRIECMLADKREAFDTMYEIMSKGRTVDVGPDPFLVDT